MQENELILVVEDSEDLNNFIPATTKKIMERFNSDLGNNFFETLENLYIKYIK